MKWAEFPEALTFENFRLEEQTIGEKQRHILKQLSWVDEYFTLIMMRPTGVEKPLYQLNWVFTLLSVDTQFFISMDRLDYLLKSKEYINKSKTRNNRIIKSDLIIIT